MKKLIRIIPFILLVFIITSCNKEKPPIVNTYHVSFLDINGNVFEEYDLVETDEVKYPLMPDVKGYKKIGYDYSDKYIDNDTIINAIYEKDSYIVKYVYENSVLYEENVLFEDAPTYPTNFKKEGHIFKGYDKIITNVEKDETINLLFEKEKYTFTFKTCYGDLIDIVTCEYMSDVMYPDPPALEGYNFTGWSMDIMYATKSEEIIACYNFIQLSVTFRGLNGKYIGSFGAIYNSPFPYPNPPEEQGYKFVGWDKIVTGVKVDTVINAIYEKISSDIKTNSLIITNVADDLNIKCDFTNDEFLNISEVEIIVDNSTYHFEYNKNFNVTINLDITSSKKLNIIGNIVFKNNSKYNVIKQTYDIYHAIDINNHYSFESLDSLLNLPNINNVVNNYDKKETYLYTFKDIIRGGFRGTNELHYYDKDTYRSRNQYGFEIAVDANGFIIDYNTLVELPDGGFILSGNGTAADILQSRASIGLYAEYDIASATLKLYRNVSILNIYSSYQQLKYLYDAINKKMIEQIPLNYKEIISNYNTAVELFNATINNFNTDIAKKINEFATYAGFMLQTTKTYIVKGFWHYPLSIPKYAETSRKSVEEFLNIVKETGFNTVYLNTNFDGACIYKSSYLKQKLTTNYIYEGYKDYLECFIEEAHKRNIRVIAWTNTLIIGDGYIPSYNKNIPHSVGYNGENDSNGMYYYDITEESVKTLLTNVYFELAKNYNLDGIEYDFIRYPSNNLYNKSGSINPSIIDDFGYTECAMNTFKQKYGISGDVRELVAKDESIRKKWLEYKIDNITNIEHMITDAIRSANKNIIITAAVMPSPTGAKNTYSQDYKSWIEDGYLDNIDPMAYTGSNKDFESDVLKLYEEFNTKCMISVGTSPDKITYETLNEQIDILAKYEKVGYVIFSNKYLFKNDLFIEGLKKTYNDYACTLYSDKETIKSSYVKTMIDQITNYYSKIYEIDNLNTLIKQYNLYYSNMIKCSSLENEINKITNQDLKDKLLNELRILKPYMEN